ncbi:MAG: PKD domain-containing protein, partial [Segetibacter sp.]
MNNFYKKTIRATWLHLVQLTILFFFTTVSFAQVHADFSATPVSGCPPMVVSFTDNSTGNPVSWKWDLGNGTISFLQNPIATYFTPGTYNVKLIVGNAGGMDSIVKSKYVVVNALPVVYFRASDTTGCFPLKVQFKDSSIAGSGSVANWQWDFGDGTLSTEQNPSHTYTSPGTFNVILRVSNTGGCSGVLNKAAYINISAGVKASFSFLTVPGCQSPSPVTFVNESSGIGTLTYRWNFGDGKTSTASNPTNNYSAGLYTVKLIAASSFGCTDTIVKTNAVAVGLIHAQISSADTICEGETLQFTNASAPTNFSSSQWDFGDGTKSTQTNPGKTYANAGSYKVKLVVVLDACKDSVTKTITVLPKPTAAFTASNASGCAKPLNVSFVNQSVNSNSYKWSFGDGSTSTLRDPVHGYTQAGTYSVSLTAFNDKGCATTITKTNLVNVTPLKIDSIKNLKIKGCLPIRVSPVAVIKDNMPVASYEWDFGDGSKSTSATPSHTYNTPGTFDVKLIITTAAGCTDTFTLKQAVEAGNRPITKFAADPKDVCAEAPVSFTDLTTTGTVNKWQWFFGDGGTSNIQNPTYVYNDTGYFSVTLIAASFGCEDTLKMEKLIHVRPPIARFDTTYFCNEPLNRNFINKSIGANTWNWNFGDGSTSTDQ